MARTKVSPRGTAVLLLAAVVMASAMGMSELASAGGNAAKPTRGGQLVVGLRAIPTIIDPMATPLQANWGVANVACEGLFTLDNRWNVRPMLVDTWSYSTANKSYVLNLRRGVTFQDGSPFTSADAVASLRRFAGSFGAGSQFGSLVQAITSPGRFRVVIELKQASGLIPALLAPPSSAAIMMPSELIGGVTAASPVSQLVCTGPYRVSSYDRDQQVTLTRFTGYKSRKEPSSAAAGAKPAHLDSVKFVAIPDGATMLAALQTGAVDTNFGAIPMNQYKTLKADKRLRVDLIPNYLLNTLVFNTSQGPMKNMKLRQAVLAALDMRKVMASHLDSNMYSLSPSYMQTPGSTWYSMTGAGAYNRQNVSKAKALMSAAGYNNEKITWITTNDGTWDGPVPEAAAQLKAVGFNIQVEQMSVATLVQRRANPGAYDMFSSVLPNYPDPALIPYLGRGYVGGWNTALKGFLADKLLTEVDVKKRKASWGKLQTVIWRQVPFLEFGSFAAMIVSRANINLEPTTAAIGANNYYAWWKG